MPYTRANTKTCIGECATRKVTLSYCMDTLFYLPRKGDIHRHVTQFGETKDMSPMGVGCQAKGVGVQRSLGTTFFIPLEKGVSEDISPSMIRHKTYLCTFIKAECPQAINTMDKFTQKHIQGPYTRVSLDISPSERR